MTVGLFVCIFKFVPDCFCLMLVLCKDLLNKGFKKKVSVENMQLNSKQNIKSRNRSTWKKGTNKLVKTQRRGVNEDQVRLIRAWQPIRRKESKQGQEV